MRKLHGKLASLSRAHSRRHAIHAAIITAFASANPSAAQPALPLAGQLKALDAVCSEGMQPEINANLDVSECLYLPRRIVWRGGLRAPLLVRQDFQREQLGSQSTGAAVWGAGLALARFMELQGPSYWSGKRVIELGTGTGLASITAAKLGAAHVQATDRDQAILRLAEANARDNLDRAERAAFTTAPLTWGTIAPPALRGADIVIGADLTYTRDAWPALAQTLRDLGAPALLAARERRPNELSKLRDFLASAGLPSTLVDSPLARGKAVTEPVVILSVDRPSSASTCTFSVEDEMAAEPTFVVKCNTVDDSLMFNDVERDYRTSYLLSKTTLPR